MNPLIYIIAGSTGAGKTTYSCKIADELSAVVYSIDNWMKDLFGGDMPDDPGATWFNENHKWYIERIARCEEKIKALSLSRAKLGQISILDLGFSSAEHRMKFINFYKDHSVKTEIHFLDIAASTRMERVEKRNKAKGETFVMTIDKTLFDYMENIFEAPSEKEGAKIIRVTGLG